MSDFAKRWMLAWGKTLFQFETTPTNMTDTPAVISASQPLADKLVFTGRWAAAAQAGASQCSGLVIAGRVVVGERLRATTSGQTGQVLHILAEHGDALPAAAAGQSVTLVWDAEGGTAAQADVLAHADHPLEMTDQFEATLRWASSDALGLMGRAYGFELAHQTATATITAIKYRVSVDTQAHEACRQLERGHTAVCNLALSQPVVFDSYAHLPALGSFTLHDTFSHAAVATGEVRHNLRRAQNVHRQALSITRPDRERLNGHAGKVIWFTGLSGSGKSTIANALEQALYAQGKRTYLLDGDNVRQGLNKDLGFTDADRVENIRRIAEVAKLMMDAGLIVMTAFISPFRAEREMARQLIGAENFVEVFVDTPLEVCEQRDPKGLYKKARRGELPNMTGINSPYEPPLGAAYSVGSGNNRLENIINTLMEKI